MSEGNTHVTISASPISSAVSKCCPTIRAMLNRVGDKWSMLIVLLLSEGPLRFNALRRKIDGISQRMLTRSLRELERDGLVSRTVTPTTPPSVEYALTPLGHTLLPPVHELIRWTLDHHMDVAAAQTRFDGERAR